MTNNFLPTHTRPVLLSWFLLLAISLLAASPLLAAPKSIGKVILATQGVTAKQANTPARSLKRGSPIYLGDTLTTPKGGKAQLRLDDGELLALTEASQVSFDEFNFEANNPKANSSVKHLVTGGLRSITGAVKDTGYQVKTQTGTIGIRGTSFEAFSQNGRNLFVNTHRGDVVVSNNAGSVEIGVNKRQRAAQITAAGQAPAAINPSQLPQQMQQAFSQDPSLALAEDTAANEDAGLASSDAYTPAEPTSISTTNPTSQTATNQTANLDDFVTREKHQEKVSNAEDLGKLEGFLFGEKFGIYISELSFTGDGSSFSINNISTYSEIDTIEGFGTVSPSSIEDIPTASYRKKDIGSFTTNPIQGDDLINLWTSVTLGDAVAIAGIYTKSHTNFEQASYIFSNKVLTEQEVNKLPISSTANYSMEFHTAINYDLETELTSGSLKVNFNNPNAITATLNGSAGFSSDKEKFTISGNGSIQDFYNSGIKLENTSGITSDIENGEIVGRFVGSNADGAIAAYSLGYGLTTGTIVFKKQ